MLLVRVHGEYTYFPVPQTVQEVHSVSLVALQVRAYWPAPQTVTVQVVHTVLPVLDVYVPAVQGEQLLAPVVAENVPATQGVQAPPDTEKVPAGQGGQV